MMEIPGGFNMSINITNIFELSQIAGHFHIPAYGLELNIEEIFLRQPEFGN
ncbi:MAG: hypothetical protein WAW07_05735 [Bacteroidales bacterium]